MWLNGATISKRSASLIGDFFLEITPGTQGDRLTTGEQIHNVDEGTSMQELFKTLDRITRDIEQVTSSLAGVFGGRGWAARSGEDPARSADDPG